MLEVFNIDVAKVDLDIAHVALQWSFKYMFQIFHLFFRRMLQVFYLDVAK
jgi:hypothetical protein